MRRGGRAGKGRTRKKKRRKESQMKEIRNNRGKRE